MVRFEPIRKRTQFHERLPRVIATWRLWTVRTTRIGFLARVDRYLIDGRVPSAIRTSND